MCGITCIYNKINHIDKNSLLDITNELRHRGPDASGIKVELNGRLGIGHTRLKLVDLSDEANQPMIIDDIVISFNGEIYNHKELRKQLEKAGYIFVTNSDTEIIIKSFKEWGLPHALDKFNGCFVFVLYDKENEKLYIVRDHIGKKQIVYSHATNGDWIFASEVKAIIKHPFIKKEPNIDRFISDLTFKFFSDKAETFFKDIYFVPAGYFVVFNLKDNSDPKFIKYWDINNPSLNKNINITNIVDELNELLKSSVELRMTADCKIGSILSGGIDSSIITKIASDYSLKCGNELACFTIKYTLGTKNDLKNARLLSKTLENIKLNEILVDKDISIEDFDKITWSLEEPLLDKVYIAQYRNYKEARSNGFKAVINGQGADELWLGYYFFYKLFQLPNSKINYNDLTKYWNNQFKFFSLSNSAYIKTKVKKIIIENLNKNFLPYQTEDKLASIVNFSIKTHLQSMFTQEDRLSMANSVEVRLPHVDMRIVKLALSVPSKIKIFDGREKYILRTLGQKFLPKQIYTRKKMAFPDPPSQYDKLAEIVFDKKAIIKSKIISAIFNSKLIYKEFYKLPIRDRWMLLAILRMEKVFFE